MKDSNKWCKASSKYVDLGPLSEVVEVSDIVEDGLLIDKFLKRKENQWEWAIVGGFLRDSYYGKPVSDLDIVVCGGRNFPITNWLQYLDVWGKKPYDTRRLTSSEYMRHENHEDEESPSVVDVFELVAHNPEKDAPDKIQLIVWNGSLQEYIDSFDSPICQFYSQGDHVMANENGITVSDRLPLYYDAVARCERRDDGSIKYTHHMHKLFVKYSNEVSLVFPETFSDYLCQRITDNLLGGCRKDSSEEDPPDETDTAFDLVLRGPQPRNVWTPMTGTVRAEHSVPVRNTVFDRVIFEDNTLEE